MLPAEITDCILLSNSLEQLVPFNSGSNSKIACSVGLRQIGYCLN